MDRKERPVRGTDRNSRPPHAATSELRTAAPLDREERIIAFLDRTGYPMVQDNGQRRYGPPPSWSGSPPPKGCEVFLGKLPRDVYEDELVPFLERAGTLYEVRLMMDFAGSNRGYAFATYSCREQAKRAVRELDDREIRPGRPVGVCHSVDNCRLFVGGIPRDKSREEVLQEMRRVTENVVDVILYRSVTDKRRNRGFAFVEYSDHKAAAVARRRMIPGRMTLWGGCEVAVDWAQPEPLVDEETMESVMVLYVRNLMPDTPEEAIQDAFSLKGKLKITKVKKIRDFAFIHYTSKEDAKEALEAMNGATIEGTVLEVSWSKPVTCGKRFTRLSSSKKKIPEQSRLCGAPVVMPGPVAGLGCGYYSLASSYIPPPIGSGRPVTADYHHSHYYYNDNKAGSGHSQSSDGGASPHRSGNTRMSPRCQRTMQLLSELCYKQGWGEPEFRLCTTVSGTSQPSCSGGDTRTLLYFYKVTVPNITPPLYNTITPNKLSHSIEEAKEYAAVYALDHLLLKLQMLSSEYPSLTSPVYLDTPPSPFGHGYLPYTAVLPGAGFYLNTSARPVYYIPGYCNAAS